MLNDTAFAIARSATRMDKTGNGHSSITSKQTDERELLWDSKVVGAEERTQQKQTDSLHVLFTILQLLPRLGGKESTAAPCISLEEHRMLSAKFYERLRT